MNDITQNQLEGFGDKSVNCSGMIFLKTEFILFIFVIVMMEFFHKSNSINLFKPQMNTSLN